MGPQETTNATSAALRRFSRNAPTSEGREVLNVNLVNASTGSPAGYDYETKLFLDSGNANAIVNQVTVFNIDTTAPYSAPYVYYLNSVGAIVVPVGPLAIPSSTSSGTETPTATIVTDSTASPVAAGKVSVTFTTNAAFVGTILGVARSANTTYSFHASQGKTLAAIAYTVTAGSMTIDVTV